MGKTFPLQVSAIVAWCVTLGCSDTNASSAAKAPASDAGGKKDSGGIQTGTTIALGDGTLEGAVQGGARHFFGIPYAEPPVGELRFRAPVKNSPWTGVR